MTCVTSITQKSVVINAYESGSSEGIASNRMVISSYLARFQILASDNTCRYWRGTEVNNLFK